MRRSGVVHDESWWRNHMGDEAYERHQKWLVEETERREAQRIRREQVKFARISHMILNQRGPLVLLRGGKYYSND